MNVANLLTLFRVFLIPVFILIFFSKIHHNMIFATLIFIIAGLTDILDGYLARKRNLITKWGIVFDPLADKLMLITVLICLCINNLVPNWIVVLVFIKELGMIIAGVILFNKNSIIPSNIFGKLATCMFYLAIILINLKITIAYYSLYLAVILAIIALINYIIFYFKNKKNNRHN